MARSFRQIGRFRYSVVLEQLAGTQDQYGQLVQTWVPWQTILCSIEQRTGSEKMVGQELFASVNVILQTRFIDGITPAMRATWGQRHFNIQAVLDSGNPPRRFLTLLCVERVESGSPGE
jgi:SPP1 family predicted phage head-tail adaptor